MKVPKYIKDKMRKVVELSRRAHTEMMYIELWLEDHGFDIDSLRCGNGCSLEELELGNDAIDNLCEWIESGTIANL